MYLKIELVVADRGWILEKIAEEILKQCPDSWDVRITTEPSDWPDIHYFIPYSKQPADKSKFSICYMTHQEDIEPSHSNFLHQAELADYCICLSSKYERILRDHGIEDVCTIETGVDLNKFDIQLQIGVVGRTYHTKRKGEDLVAQCMDIDNIQFLFTGSGWPGPSVHLHDSELPSFFNKLDYLLIPSRIEGGPVPLMEALASGCKVIAPSDIGFVEQFPHIPFENGNVESLRETLKKLVVERESLRDSVKNFSWEKCGKLHIELFERLAVEHKISIKKNTEHVPKLRKVYLVSHGTESTNKGGPTTRMRFISQYAISQGLDVEIISDTSSLPSSNTQDAIVHVFNSWPLKSSLRQIRTAKNSGYRVVYSPIALNLEYHDFYAHTVPRLLNSAEGLLELQQASSRIRNAEDYKKLEALVPSEGVKDHFYYLQSSISMADGVVLLSHYEQRFLQKAGCILGDSVVIENGVDSEVMAKACPYLFKKKYNLDRYVLVVGRIEARKNQAAIAAALSDSDLTLVVIGHCVSSSYMALVKQCSQGNIVHIDRVEDRALLASAYRGAAIFLMSSWVEGAPLSALEAASAGVPLVLSNQSSEQEYFGDDALYVNPADIANISAQVKILANNKEVQTEAYRNRMAAKYQPLFSSDLHSSKTIDYYNHVVTVGQEAKSVNQPLGVYLDVTHWAHSAHGGIHPTGVTRVEESYARELIAEKKGAKFLVWNSPLRLFLSLSAEDIRNNVHIELCNSRSIPHQHSKKVIPAMVGLLEYRKCPRSRPWRRVFDKLIDIEDQTATVFRVVDDKNIGLTGALLSHLGAYLKSVFLIKYLVGKLFIWPLRFVNRLVRFFEGGKYKKAEPQPAHFEAMKSDRELYMANGTELVLLGQPWISNDKYLHDLTQLVEENGVKLVTMIQDLLYVTHSNSHDSKDRAAYRKRLYKLMSISNRLLVSSDYIGGLLKKLLSYRKLNIRVDKFSYAEMNLLGDLNVVEDYRPSATPYLLFVSSINNRKNHGFLIDVWKFLKDNGRIIDAKLVLVGKDQSNGALSELLSAHSKYGIQHLDAVGDKALHKLYLQCSGTVYPSESEGWGLPIQESIAYGKRCIAGSKCPAANELKSDLVTIVDSSDFFRWCEEIERLLSKK